VRGSFATNDGARRPVAVIAFEACEPIVNRENNLLGRPIGVVHDEGPAEPAHRLNEITAVLLEALLVALAQGLGTPGYHAVSAFARGELGAATVGEGLLCWVQHLHEMPAHALHRDLLQAFGRLRHRLEKIAE